MEFADLEDFIKCYNQATDMTEKLGQKTIHKEDGENILTRK